MDIEQQLRVALAPCEPGPAPMDVVMRRLSVRAGGWGSSKRRTTRTVVVVGTALVLAAAAAMLARRLPQPADGEMAASLLAPTVGIAATIAPKSAETSAAGGDELQASVPMEKPAPVDRQSPRPASFTVLVQPLELDSSDPAVQLAVQEYYAHLLDELRGIPGLRLLGTTDAGSGNADFRITIVGRDPSDSRLLGGRAKWEVVLRNEERKDGAYRPARLASIQTGGVLDPVDCPVPLTGPADACTPGGIAAGHARSMSRGFPRNAALEKQLQAQAGDVSSSGEERARALLEAMSRQQKAGTMMDEDVIHAAIDLITGPAHAARRINALNYLRIQANPGLVEPLIRLSREETDDAVRLAAVSALAAGFSSFPAARAELAVVARDDRSLLVRKVAERAIAGEAAWRDYVVASVRDSGSTLKERFAPFAWMIEGGSYDPAMKRALPGLAPELLQRVGAATLADLLVGVHADRGDSMNALRSLGVLEALSDVDDPSVPELLVRCFQGMSDEISLHLLAQRRADPRVREELERIAASHPKAALRERAAAYLDRPAASRGSLGKHGD